MQALNFVVFLVCVVTLVARSHMDMLACKKQEKPIGNKCERLKMDEEKKDGTKEQLVKKKTKK